MVQHDRGTRDIREPNYVDPVGKLSIPSASAYDVDWIAAIAPMNSTKMPWLVVVQEKRDVVVKPVEEMEVRMRRQAVYAVLAKYFDDGCHLAVCLAGSHAIRSGRQTGNHG